MKIDRRRLIKGSLAAPVVLTVRPASATAITSATACFNRCETIAKERRPAKFTHAKHGDEWMRVECDLYRLSPAVGKDFYPGKYFLGFDKHTYWRVDDRNPYYGNPEPSKHTRGSCYAENTGQKMYGIAYVDRTGNIQGFVSENKHHGTPVTWSCYTSAIGMKYKT
jgi:hypothetical protein